MEFPKALLERMGLKEQILVVLYTEGPKELGELASRLAQKPRTVRYLLERVLPALEREGLVRVAEGKVGLLLEEKKPTPKTGKKERQVSPVQALAEAHPARAWWNSPCPGGTSCGRSFRRSWRRVSGWQKRAGRGTPR